MEELIKNVFNLADEHHYKKSGPKEYDVLNKTSNTEETLLQRIIIDQKISIIENAKIQWLDIELPVILNENHPRPRIDIIGRDESMNFVICKLKFGKSEDSPESALFQILEYYLCILFNSSELDLSGIHHSNADNSWKWSEISKKNTILVIGGDSVYWNSWKGKYEKGLIDRMTKLIGIQIFYYKVDKKNNWTKVS